jgi:glycerol-3-phosphate cytidylyltransferase
MSKKILYTGGTFDLFHSGHVNFLSRCKLLADEVVVSLNTDQFIKSYKGFNPFHSYEQRKLILESCVYCDKVVPNTGNDDSTEAIERVQPHIIAIGTDWATKDYYAQMGFTQEWLDIRNIVLIYIPYTQDVSSTIIKAKIAEHYNQ